MTDLRELLREAACELEHASRGVIDETYCGDLHRRIDAVLAQPPDAKPVAWLVWESFHGVDGGQSTLHLSDKEYPGAFPVYDSPQPPAGKGEPAASGRIRAWIRGAMQPSTPHGPAEYNEECVPGEDQPEGKGWMPLYFLSPDAIPREIHERLVRDAKSQALREAAQRLKRKISNEVFDEIYALAADYEAGRIEHERDG
jgi:hypothetical protein